MVYLFKIRELCDRIGVSMKQAALDLGMTEQSLHKLIKVNSTKIDTLMSIANYFKVEPAYFFDSHSGDINQYVKISKNELSGLIKKVLAYSIHGFGMVKLEWVENEEKFNSYFDLLNKQYTPTIEDLEYISSILETEINTKIEILDTTTPKDISKFLMTEDEFDFISTYYYSLRKKEMQEEMQKLSAFIGKHNILMTEAIEKDIQELHKQIKYFESKSVIGTNK